MQVRLTRCSWPVITGPRKPSNLQVGWVSQRSQPVANRVVLNGMSLRALFNPRTVAVIGASTVKGSVGNDIAQNLATQGYQGKLYFVNPKGGTLYGHRLLRDISEVNDEVDLAIVAVPAAAVITVLQQAFTKKLKAAVVISAGFKEVGKTHEEAALAQICEDHGVSLIGPNCLGLINPELKLNASFAPLMPQVGPIAFISQSGAICASVLDYARQRGMGFSKFISVGNKALIGETELLEYLYHDSQTKVIALYVEQLKEIQHLRQTVLKITRGKPSKPILILKSGRTAAGQKAASSHTGSLGGSDDGYEALFAQIGVIRAESISELFDFAGCFADNSLLKNNRVVVITNAGGPGVITADELLESGMRLAELSAETKSRLQQFLPAAASVRNPVDILGDADDERYQKALQLVLQDERVDAIQIILTPQSMTPVEKVAQAIVKARHRNKKPLVVTFMGQKLVEEGLDILHTHQVATTTFPEPGARSLGALHKFVQWLKPRNQRHFAYPDIDRERVQRLMAPFQGKAEKLLPLDVTMQILDAYGFPLVKRATVTTPAAALQFAQSVRGEVVLKVVSPDINHKSDVGGVMLHVTPDQVATAYAELLKRVKKNRPQARITGVEMMEMVSDEGLEIILGASSDRSLGKQLMVGLGGVYTEALQDVAWGIAPLTQADAARMIHSLKSAKILAGIRGQGPLASEVVVECLGRLSILVTDFPQIKELDINPLKVLSQKKGALVLDGRIILT